MNNTTTDEVKPGERVVILGTSHLRGEWGTVTHCDFVPSFFSSSVKLTRVFAKWDMWPPTQNPTYMPRDEVCTSFVGHAGNPCVFCGYSEGGI